VITHNIASVKLHGSAITTSTVKETILIVNQNDEILSVPERKYSRVAKAPQSFWLDDILDVHYRAQKDGILDFIDSCTMMKKYGEKLFMVDGPYENIKITTPNDFYTLRAILDAKEDAQIYGFE
jgi:2-C-methyl-D-erythritol 4-phosphate cytidylyltransferase